MIAQACNLRADMVWWAWFWFTGISVGPFPRLSLQVMQKESAVPFVLFKLLWITVIPLYLMFCCLFAIQYCCKNLLGVLCTLFLSLLLVLFTGLNIAFFEVLKAALLTLLFPPVLILAIKCQPLSLANKVSSCSHLFSASCSILPCNLMVWRIAQNHG